MSNIGVIVVIVAAALILTGVVVFKRRTSRRRADRLAKEQNRIQRLRDLKDEIEGLSPRLKRGEGDGDFELAESLQESVDNSLYAELFNRLFTLSVGLDQHRWRAHNLNESSRRLLRLLNEAKRLAGEQIERRNQRAREEREYQDTHESLTAKYHQYRATTGLRERIELLVKLRSELGSLYGATRQRLAQDWEFDTSSQATLSILGELVRGRCDELKRDIQNERDVRKLHGFIQTWTARAISDLTYPREWKELLTALVATPERKLFVDEDKHEPGVLLQMAADAVRKQDLYTAKLVLAFCADSDLSRDEVGDVGRWELASMIRTLQPELHLPN